MYYLLGIICVINVNSTPNLNAGVFLNSNFTVINDENDNLIHISRKNSLESHFGKELSPMYNTANKCISRVEVGDYVHRFMQTNDPRGFSVVGIIIWNVF